MENRLQTTGKIQGQVHSHYELSIPTTPKMHYQLPQMSRQSREQNKNALFRDNVLQQVRYT